MTQVALTRAVIVGIEDYQAGSSWRLNGPALDACRFAHWLTSRGVPAERITVVVSPLPENAGGVAKKLEAYDQRAADQATVHDIFTRDLPDETSDLLIVYWGGHGVIEREERRLIYADATAQDKRNLNLSSLLTYMRSERFAGHPLQICFVDACMNLSSELGWKGDMPSQTFGWAQPESQRDQRVLLAASPGERAVNVDELRTGMFSLVVQEELDAQPTWPPNVDLLRDRVNDRFQRLREEHRTRQVPTSLWFISRSGESTLLFASGTAISQAGAAAAGGQLLTFAEHWKLTAILDGARAPSNLRELYRDATRDVVGLQPPTCPDDLLSTVEALRRPLSARPLFRFLVHFAGDSDAGTRDRLWAWIDATAPSWGVDLDELRALKMELGRSIILLRLKPDLLGDGLLLTGWTYEGADGRQSVANDEPCDDERLSAEISRLVQHVDPPRDPLLPLIEFLMPVAMLDYQCDTIKVRIRGQSHLIGATFPVVVRPLDRASDAASYKFQLEAWATIKAHCGVYDETAICWVDESPVPVKLDAHVCAALAYARSTGPADDPAFKAVLAAGVPVALWHRDSGHRPDPRAALQEVLRSRALQKLPDVVRSQRFSAGLPGASRDHAGHDLVLLWDNPHRIPQDCEWHPPAKDGGTG